MLEEAVHEDTETRDWRYAQLRKLGVGHDDAWELRERRDVAHELERLLERGCSPQIAVKILR